jgi:hypothetical protein
MYGGVARKAGTTRLVETVCSGRAWSWSWKSIQWGLMSTKKFSNMWKNQTELGKRFGLTSIAVGKILTECGLKDGKSATQKALDEGYATFTPLKDGTPFYLWNVAKVSSVISQKHRTLTEVELHVNEVRARLQEANMMLDDARISLVICWLM